MNFKRLAVSMFAASMAMAAFGKISVPEGTPVDLVFTQGFSSKTAHKGEVVYFRVNKSVTVDGQVVVRDGTPARGIISEVSGRGKYGKNAVVRITLEPVRDVNGRMLPLEPRQKGKEFKGGRTDKAAIATGAGAVLLGPIGLIGGYFIPGKNVVIKAGTHLNSQIAKKSEG